MITTASVKRIRIPLLAFVLVLVFSFVTPIFSPTTPVAEARTVEAIQNDLVKQKQQLDSHQIGAANEQDPAIKASMEKEVLKIADKIEALQRELELEKVKDHVDIPTASASLLKNPLQGKGGLPQIIGNIIKGLLQFSGAAALLIFVWGGLQMIISQGDASKYEAGKNTLVWAVIGLAVIFTSYALVATIIATLAG